MNEHSLIPEQRAAHVSQYIQDGLAIGMLFLLVGKAHPDCKPPMEQRNISRRIGTVVATSGRSPLPATFVSHLRVSGNGCTCRTGARAGCASLP